MIRLQLSRSRIIFFALLLIYAYFFPRWAEWNQNSRMDLVLAVVDKASLSIDDYYQNTGDYAAFGNHFYSDKAPGTAFAGIPFYLVFKTIVRPLVEPLTNRLAANTAFAATLNPEGTGLLADKIYFFLALVFVTFFVVAIPSALLGVLFYQLTARFTANELARVGLTFAFALATPAFAYSNLYYGHQVAAFCLFAAFYLLCDWRKHQQTWRIVLVGFLFALALITEYPSALIIAGVGLYGLYQVRDWRRWIWFAVGGISPLLVAAIYNYTIFKTPLPMGYEYSALWQDVHSVGFLSLTLPRADALWGITFSSYRGVFLLSPYLLLAVPGFFFFWRAKKYRAEFWVALWAAVSFFLFNGSSAMWTGGFAVGPRYLIPALPFLAFPIVFFVEQVRAPWARALTALLVLVSFGLVWLETISGQSFPQFQLNPLIDYSLPHFISGDMARNLGMLFGLRGWSSLLPLPLALAILVVVSVAWERRQSFAPRAPQVESPS